MTTNMTRTRRGASAIEFALLFPGLIFMTSGVIDFGTLLNQQLLTVNAVREGARAGSIALADHETAAATAVEAVLAAGGVDDVEVNTSLSGDVLTVSVVVPFSPWVGLVPTPEANVETLVTQIQNQEAS